MTRRLKGLVEGPDEGFTLLYSLGRRDLSAPLNPKPQTPKPLINNVKPETLQPEEQAPATLAGLGGLDAHLSP